MHIPFGLKRVAREASCDANAAENILLGRRTRWDHGLGVSTPRGNYEGESRHLQITGSRGGGVALASDGRFERDLKIWWHPSTPVAFRARPPTNQLLHRTFACLRGAR